MAYSNWGAFVFCNGKRRRDCEDVPVFGDRSDETAAPSGARIFVNLLKLRGSGDTEASPSPWWQHAHHAVLGDGSVRLCGYKSYPELYVTDGETVTKIDVPWPYDSQEMQSGEVNGCKWTAEPCNDGNEVTLTLVEADGSTWTAQCGYCIGAGHDESDPEDA